MSSIRVLKDELLIVRLCGCTKGCDKKDLEFGRVCKVIADGDDGAPIGGCHTHPEDDPNSSDGDTSPNAA